MRPGDGAPEQPWYHGFAQATRLSDRPQPVLRSLPVDRHQLWGSGDAEPGQFGWKTTFTQPSRFCLNAS